MKTPRASGQPKTLKKTNSLGRLRADRRSERQKLDKLSALQDDALMTYPTTDRILYALFCLSRDTCHIDASELGIAAGVSAAEAAKALVTLERLGLVDASRERLTMLGLARASALSASGSGGPRVDLRRKKARVKANALPVAAQSVIPPAPEPSREREAPSHQIEQEPTYAQGAAELPC